MSFMLANRSLMAMQGRIAREGAWFNLSLQGPQPLFQAAARVCVRLKSKEDSACVSMDVLQAAMSAQQAFQGGNYLSLKGQQHRHARPSVPLTCATCP
jgi:conjugal transfer/entry exclusion protein